MTMMFLSSRGKRTKTNHHVNETLNQPTTISIAGRSKGHEIVAQGKSSFPASTAVVSLSKPAFHGELTTIQGRANTTALMLVDASKGAGNDAKEAVSAYVDGALVSVTISGSAFNLTRRQYHNSKDEFLFDKEGFLPMIDWNWYENLEMTAILQ